MCFSFPPLDAQLTSSAVLLTIFRICGNGDYGVCYVSQHEKISTCAPHFCVAYQAPHAVAAEASHAVSAEVPHAVAADGTHAVAAEVPHAVASISAPCGRRRWNPRSRRRRIPCCRRRPARAHVCRSRRPSSSTPRARPSTNDFNTSSRDTPALS